MIRIGIVGYGNLGRGVEYAIRKNDDMKLVGIFTRREPTSVETVFNDVKVYHIDDAPNFKDEIDVMILCGGSATDLPVQGPMLLSMFNTVDSFDTHAKIPEYLEKMNAAAKKSGKCGVISVGWDPGLFSMARVLFSSFLTTGKNYTFWGKGVSQGHSDAIRRIDGVIDAKQYTIPKQEALDSIKAGDAKTFTPRDMHLRECFVVAADTADKAKIEKEICNMPNYFSDYDTIVHFISLEEFKKDHSNMPHGGFVIRTGTTGQNDSSNHMLELSIKLDSNPEFTSSILVAFARAIYRLSNEGVCGAKTVFDIPLAYLSNKNIIEML
ncbi:MAG: diaminopimelate dehydrogenase [Clostridia bacterium]